jgi:hypothetical protein
MVAKVLIAAVKLGGLPTKRQESWNVVLSVDETSSHQHPRGSVHSIDPKLFCSLVHCLL